MCVQPSTDDNCCSITVQAVEGGIEIYWLKYGQQNDVYPTILEDILRNNQMLNRNGFLFVVTCKVRGCDSPSLTSRNDAMARRVIIRVLGSGSNSTIESRLDGLGMLECACLGLNHYEVEHTAYARHDVTPKNPACFEKPDCYLLDSVIYDIIQFLYRNTGPNWYARNRHLAQQYWTGPDYPLLAISSLGYPCRERHKDNVRGPYWLDKFSSGSADCLSGCSAIESSSCGFTSSDNSMRDFIASETDSEFEGSWTYERYFEDNNSTDIECTLSSATSTTDTEHSSSSYSENESIFSDFDY